METAVKDDTERKGKKMVRQRDEKLTRSHVIVVNREEVMMKERVYDMTDSRSGTRKTRQKMTKEYIITERV